MFQGYYSLASAMISQNRNLNVISNNMANVSTPGYKSDQYIASTFKEEVLYRSGNITPDRKTAIGTTARIQATNARITSYEQGALDPTGSALDLAINGDGFFTVQTEDGIVYSRNGSLITDDEGYLAIPGVGRILGNNGAIRLDTDDIIINEDGSIWGKENGTNYGTIRLTNFTDYSQIIKGDNGTFTQGEATEAQPNAVIKQGMVERSNSNMVDEMTSMMSAQRSLQAAAQLFKMYDQLDAKTAQIAQV